LQLVKLLALYHIALDRQARAKKERNNLVIKIAVWQAEEVLPAQII